VAGVEPIEENLHADAAAAADFQDVLAGEVPAGQSAEPAGFAMVLVRGTERVVHRDAFDGVELHAGCSCLIDGGLGGEVEFVRHPARRVGSAHAEGDRGGVELSCGLELDEHPVRAGLREVGVHGERGPTVVTIDGSAGVQVREREVA
jgi:hypothetical protein